MPKISILIPALVDTPDKVGWLAECLQSIKDQSESDFEAIIVDDFSPLPFDEALQAVSGDNRFIYVRTPERSGPAKCRNTAAALAKGEALLPVDSDDRLTPDALKWLYNEWQKDRKKIVYGDLQRIIFDGSQWTVSRVIALKEYTFDNTLDLRGSIPVTAMHSQEAWQQAGGWKAQFGAGLEDVEYWITLGELGFCGRHIDYTTLQYRKHETSRTYNVRHVELIDNKPADEVMRQRIIEAHQDVFQGRYPMGCCGSRSGSSSNGGNNSPQMMSMMNLSGNMERNAVLAEDDLLPGLPADETLWVKYVGKRGGRWAMRGRQTNRHYTIRYRGHKRQIDIRDRSTFEGKREAGQTVFAVGVPAPIEHAEPVIVEDTPPPPPMPVAKPAPPIEMATIMRTAEPPSSIPIMAITDDEPVDDYDLGKLRLTERIAARYNPSNIHDMLQQEGWSLQKLAKADPKELQEYPGIGPATAKTIIEAAQEAI